MGRATDHFQQLGVHPTTHLHLLHPFGRSFIQLPGFFFPSRCFPCWKKTHDAISLTHPPTHPLHAPPPSPPQTHTQQKRRWSPLDRQSYLKRNGNSLHGIHRRHCFHHLCFCFHRLYLHSLHRLSPHSLHRASFFHRLSLSKGRGQQREIMRAKKHIISLEAVVTARTLYIYIPVIPVHDAAIEEAQSLGLGFPVSLLLQSCLCDACHQLRRITWCFLGGWKLWRLLWRRRRQLL